MRATDTPLAKAIRDARGAISQPTFAYMTGLAQSTLWRYENGTRIPTTGKEIDALARAGVSRRLMEDAIVAKLRQRAGFEQTAVAQ